MLHRRHRITNRVVGEAWAEERVLLRPIPERILAGLSNPVIVAMPTPVVDLQVRRLGEQVEVRDLAEYEAMVR